MEKITFLSSFFAGVFSFFSPCIFPLFGVYLSFITGMSLDDLKTKSFSKKIVLFRILFFILGFTFTFIVLGIFSRSFFSFLFKNKILLRKLIAFVIFFFSIHILGIFEILKIKFLQKFLNSTKKLDIFKLNISTKYKLFFNFVFGILFAFSWTPCVGPILGSILAMASLDENIKAVLLLSMYSLGLGISFFISTAFYNILISKTTFISRYLVIFQKIIGFILLILSFFIFKGVIL